MYLNVTWRSIDYIIAGRVMSSKWPAATVDLRRIDIDDTLAHVHLNVLIAPWPIRYSVRMPVCFLRIIRVTRLSFHAAEHLFDSRRTAMIAEENVSDV